MINTYSLELDEEKHPVLIVKEKNPYIRKTIGTPKDAVDIANQIFHLNKLAEEYAVMIATASDGTPLGLFEVSHGTINMSCCNTREIFLRALVVGAAGIVILHNHPSGKTEPSKCDMDTENKILQAAKLMGIDLLDFIIVGEDNYWSCKEANVL
jgi:DNA repair protein RadC